MAIDFPNSPVLNQTYSFGNKSWKYDGEKWVVLDQSANLNNQIYDIILLNKMETN